MKTLNKKYKQTRQTMGRLLPKSLEQGILEHHFDRLQEMRVRSGPGTMLKLKGKDLRELLYLFSEDEVEVSNRLAYRILIRTGILLNGFIPSKTALRQKYKLSIKRVNEILPGSFPSEEE